MKNLLQIVEDTEVSQEPWKHLYLQGIEVPVVNWKGKTRKVFTNRVDLLDKVSSVQEILNGSEFHQLLEAKFGPLDFSNQLTYYFIDREGYEILPHTDIKIFTMLFYQSEAEICLCRSPLRKFGKQSEWYNMTEIIRKEMKPGDAILFKPSDDTWHAVRPTQKVERRSIQHFYLKKGARGK